MKREFFERNREALSSQAVLLAASLNRGGKLITFGNGGSAADAQRAAACLIRRGMRAIALPTMYTPDGPSFASLYQALRSNGDCALAISTSGNSENVLKTVEMAQQNGDTVIAFSGNGGGRLRGLVPNALLVGDENTRYSTARIQEVHLMLVHELCAVAAPLVNYA